MTNNYEEQVRQDWEKFQNTTHLPNIMLLGVTGCGKSSLINMVFGQELAAVNNVSRGTEEFSYYRGKDYGLKVNLIDSKGYEMAAEGTSDNFQWYLNEVKNMIASKKSDINDKIHIIWFCISVASNRIQQYDIEMIKHLCDNSSDVKGKVAVVLTKCDEDDEEGNTAKTFKEILHKNVSFDLPIFEVSTDKKLPLDIKKLTDWSVDRLDSEDLKNAFVASQMVDIQQKRIRAAKAIAGYAIGAAAIGAAPIPFSDAALLVPEQLTMTTHIISIYGMNNLTSLSKSLIGDIIITTIGKSLAGELVKLIPAVGKFLGAAINAGVASTITAALGFAISEICYNACKKIARNEKVDFESMFNKEDIEILTKQFVKNSKNVNVKDLNAIEKAIAGERED